MAKIYILLYRVFSFFVRNIPKSLEKPTIVFFAKILSLLDNRRGKVAKVNLDFAYGEEISEEEKNEIVKSCYKNLVRNFISFVQMQQISKDELLSLLEFENSELVEDLLRNGERIIFLTSHYGNWEHVSLGIGAKFDIKLTVVGRALGIEELDRELEESRARFGVEVLDKKGATKELIKTLKNGNHIGMLVDQNCGEKSGVLVDFFGKKARHLHSGSILSRKFDAPIVFVHSKIEDEKNIIKFVEVYRVKKSDDIDRDILEATQKQAEVEERYIRENPKEWFWFHRRWKNQHEEIYRI